MEAQHSHPAHGLHAEHSVAMFRDKCWLCMALTLPVVYWSNEVQRSLGYRAPTFSGSRLIPAILGTFIFVYGGKVFIQGARHELSGPKPGMMTLISLGIVVAFAASLISTLGIFEVDVGGSSRPWSASCFSDTARNEAVAQAHGARDALASLLPDTAERITQLDIEKVPLASLRVGDVVLVRPGSRVLVLEGTADVDESLITGESRAISKAPGAAVARRKVIQTSKAQA